MSERDIPAEATTPPAAGRTPGVWRRIIRFFVGDGDVEHALANERAREQAKRGAAAGAVEHGRHHGGGHHGQAMG